ncbi:polyprenyl synthetase family protein [Halobacteriovorax sp. GB3]|uniref:polyprenyl synthetase family protein n=1 Tax=Halobacteriovorax sp. GB3 TaxID=2719615 RepID=UPI00236083BC|nr:polyprenyl synthetase family protein [Halobacteriovorax sp. GB3]MDD0852291.1 polyprenyl synthetase family protein [Halobacteriovorax sp. GB3]
MTRSSFDIEKERQIIVNDLESHINSFAPKHEFKEIYDYAVLPPGKAFRPLLTKALAKDLNKSFDQRVLENLSYFSSAVEIHHSYTLVHDDMPCMDDDETRRGKPATHIKYGQWKALLAGDGLLIMSFGLCSKINSKNLKEVMRIFSHATGPKGLIHGQCLDLSEQMNDSFSNLIETHKLKTARLIQLALLGGAILSKEDLSLKMAKDIARIGYSLGVNFQLLDDLTELTEKKLTEHELAINPWLRDESKENCLNFLSRELKRTKELVKQYKLENLETVLEMYYMKIRSLLNNDMQMVSEHTKMDLNPIMLLLDLSA